MVSGDGGEVFVSEAIRSYRDLIVWQKAIEWVSVIYQLTEAFPQQETFGLTNQLRRAAVPVPSNIAEGQARQSTNEFRHFLYVARGSLAEVDTQLLIAINLGYIQEEEITAINNTTSEIQKMLSTLINRLPRSSK